MGSTTAGSTCCDCIMGSRLRTHPHTTDREMKATRSDELARSSMNAARTIHIKMFVGRRMHARAAKSRDVVKLFPVERKKACQHNCTIRQVLHSEPP